MQNLCYSDFKNNMIVEIFIIITAKKNEGRTLKK